MFFVEVLRSCEPPEGARHGVDAPSRSGALQPLPHMSLVSIARLQREMLQAAAAHVHACCDDGMPPSVAAVRHILPLCAHTMPQHSVTPAAVHGRTVAGDGAEPHEATPARTATPCVPTNPLGSGMLPSPLAAESGGASARDIGSTPVAGCFSEGVRLEAGISAGAPPGGYGAGTKYHSIAQTSSSDIDAGQPWEYPVLQAVLEVALTSVDCCAELEGEFEETEAGEQPPPSPLLGCHLSTSAV